jgi:hypothetical protein
MLRAPCLPAKSRGGVSPGVDGACKPGIESAYAIRLIVAKCFQKSPTGDSVGGQAVKNGGPETSGHSQTGTRMHWLMLAGQAVQYILAA